MCSKLNNSWKLERKREVIESSPETKTQQNKKTTRNSVDLVILSSIVDASICKLDRVIDMRVKI